MPLPHFADRRSCCGLPGAKLQGRRQAGLHADRLHIEVLQGVELRRRGVQSVGRRHPAIVRVLPQAGLVHGEVVLRERQQLQRPGQGHDAILPGGGGALLQLCDVRRCWLFEHGGSVDELRHGSCAERHPGHRGVRSDRQVRARGYPQQAQSGRRLVRRILDLLGQWSWHVPMHRLRSERHLEEQGGLPPDRLPRRRGRHRPRKATRRVLVLGHRHDL
mmetsp:Transcript_18705/g.54069  ORF Transcript_18705/g.54069 Transcript_18705/m.54069 type:complete len:218 (-) Transcript_18705:1673-2326(-)